jgi:hypothetical protein
MSRRVSNYYFLFTKLIPTLPECAVEELHPLVMLMQTVMTPEARQRFGLRGQDSAFADSIALHAAFDGLGQARGCRMHFTSFPMERNLLSSAYRRVKRGDEKVEAQAEEEIAQQLHPDRNFGWEPWHFALRDLLHLSCRFATYIRLFHPRLNHLWKGPLAEVIWSPRPQRPVLSTKIKSFVELDAELTMALVQLHEGEKQNDPVSVFLRRLDKAAHSDPLRYESWDRRRAWLQHVLDALPDPLPPASCYPHVAQALGRLGVIRDRLGGATLGRAWSEFGRELVAPRVLPADQSPPESIVAVLNIFYQGEHHHADERPPAIVLRLILGMPPAPAIASVPPGAVPQGFDETRRLLIAHLIRATLAGGPEADVLSAALSNTEITFDTLRDAINPHPPAALSGDLLADVLCRLGTWLAEYQAQQLRLRAWQQEAIPPESFELLDLHRAAWDEGVLSEAIQTVGAWVETPAGPRLSWTELPVRTARAIRSAVVSACLDVLCEAMNDFFLALRGRRPPSSESER